SRQIPSPTSTTSAMYPHTPTSTLFPYTTLFRSRRDRQRRRCRRHVRETEPHATRGTACARRLRTIPNDAAAHAAHPRDNDAWYRDRKSTRLNSSHQIISYAVFCLKKKIKYENKW